MKKRAFLKKALSLLMVAVMTVGIAPLSTFASADTNSSTTETEIIYGTEGVLSYKIENGEVTITECDRAVLGNLTVPSTIHGYPVTKIGVQAFYLCVELKKIELSEKLKFVDDFAFMGCVNLEEIIISDSVVSIGEQACAMCINLKSITLGNNLEFVDLGAFGGTSIDKIIIPKSLSEISYPETTMHTINTLQKIIVEENNPNYSSDMDGVLYNKNKTSLLVYPVGKVASQYIILNSVDTIETEAFRTLSEKDIEEYCERANYVYQLEKNNDELIYDVDNNTVTIKDIYIGTNVKFIKDQALSSCATLTDIHYAGSEEEWNKIDIQDTIPENITIHFNSLPCEHINKTFVKYTSHPEHYAVYKCVDCEEEIIDTVVNKLEECEECYPECKHTNTYTKITKEPTCTASGSGREICSDCGEIVSAIAIPASHSWGEWKITKTPTDKSEGEKQRLCKACFMAEAVEIPKLDVQIENEETGIIVGVPEGAYENDIELVVEQQADDTAYEITSVIDGVVNSVVFDITTKVKGEETQPTTPVIVKIPVPSNFNKNKTFLYHQSGEDYEKINYKIEDNYIVFEASQFSYYSLVELEIVSIKVEKAPATTEFTYKSDVSADGLKVIAVYSDLSEVDVTENVNITNFDTAERGSRTATVEFEGKTATFNYTVKYVWWQWLILIFLLGFIWY